MTMVSFKYDGKDYYLSNNKWVDKNGLLPPLIIQSALNKAYYETLDYTGMPIEELIEIADVLKANESFGLALKVYEYAVSNSTAKEIKYYLPRMSSCLRKMGMPEKAIELSGKAKTKYGSEVITSVLLTSIAAAFCDLGMFIKAEKCANQACSMEKGNPSVELLSVMSRIERR